MRFRRARRDPGTRLTGVEIDGVDADSRELTERERGTVVQMLVGEGDEVEVLRASVPYLRVTRTCGCGCESFDVEDSRLGPQPWTLEEFSSATDGTTGLLLFLGGDGRLASVDILYPDGADLPDPASLTVRLAGLRR